MTTEFQFGDKVIIQNSKMLFGLVIHSIVSGTWCQYQVAWPNGAESWHSGDELQFVSDRAPFTAPTDLNGDPAPKPKNTAHPKEALPKLLLGAHNVRIAVDEAAAERQLLMDEFFGGDVSAYRSMREAHRTLESATNDLSEWYMWIGACVSQDGTVIPKEDPQ